MVKKIGILIGVFLLLLVVWIAIGMWVTDLYGGAGLGGSMLIGFVTVPLVLRFLVIKLFKAGAKTPEF